MTIFTSTLNQTAFLFTFIFAGWILAKRGVLASSSATVLSKLENNLFIPALCMGTFIENFTVDRIGEMWRFMAVSAAIELVVIPLAILIPKLLSKDGYLQKISTYGLAISNWGFMGNAVVLGLFPDLFFEYIIFTLPLWIVNFLWAMPCLLMPLSAKPTFVEKLKNLGNEVKLEEVAKLQAENDRLKKDLQKLQKKNRNSDFSGGEQKSLEDSLIDAFQSCFN